MSSSGAAVPATANFVGAAPLQCDWNWSKLEHICLRHRLPCPQEAAFSKHSNSMSCSARVHTHNHRLPRHSHTERQGSTV
eukprot:2239972-Amphidinium_carterae.1